MGMLMALVACPTEDDGPTATVSIEATGAMATEQGSDGEFTIRLTGDTTTAAVMVPITLAITGVTAAHTDYALTATSPASLTGSDGSRSVTIPTGAASAILTLSAEDDADTTNETLTLTLGEGIDGGGITVSRTTTVSDQSASVTIVDNDRAATEATIAATIADASEGATPTDGEFTISLNGKPPTGGVRVHFIISGTATAGADYTSTATLLADGYVVIDQQPSRSTTIAVDVTDDTRVEDDETVIVTLDRVTDTSGMPIGSITASNPSNTDATVTIADDDGTVEASLTLDTTSITEGDGGTTSQMLTITPALTFSETGSTLGSAVTIDNLAIGSASTAIVGAGEDYTITTALTPTTLTIAAGSGAATSLTGATITLSIVGDTNFEPDETIRFTADAAGTALANAGTIGVDFTITDNDSATVTVTSIAVMEGDSGTTNIQVMVVADNTPSGGIEVTLTPETATASVPTAIDTGDFTLNDPATTVTLTDTTAQSVTIGTVTGDDLAEGDFTIPVTVTVTTTPTGRAVLASGSDMVDVVITDDDPATLSYVFDLIGGVAAGPTLINELPNVFSISPVVAHLVESGTVMATFTLSIEGTDTAELSDLLTDKSQTEVITTERGIIVLIGLAPPDADTDDECLRGTVTWTVTPAGSLTGSLTPQGVTDLTAAMTALVTLDPANDNPVRLAIEDADDGDAVISPACPPL